MPQPLRKRVSLDFWISKIADHPSLGVRIGQVVAASALLESRLSGLLAMLSGGNAEVTLAMFLAVNSTEAQRAMLRSAAEAALSGQELEALTELLDEYRSRSRERNKIVHGIWATAPEVPDALLLVRALDLAQFNKYVANHSLNRPREPLPFSISEHLAQSCMIYREKDFDDVLSRLIAFDNQIVDFWSNLLNARLDAAATGEQGALPLEDQGLDPRPQED